MARFHALVNISLFWPVKNRQPRDRAPVSNRDICPLGSFLSGRRGGGCSIQRQNNKGGVKGRWLKKDNGKGKSRKEDRWQGLRGAQLSMILGQAHLGTLQWLLLCLFLDLNSLADTDNHNNVLGHQQENILNTSALFQPGCFGGVFKGFTMEVIPPI